jgi:hypothetical protein
MYGYSERGGSLQVWLDAWSSDKADVPWPGDARGVVCEKHALSMSAPVGWDFIDRRESAPRLFVPRPVLVHSRSIDGVKTSPNIDTTLRVESAPDSDAVSRAADESAVLRRKRVTELPIPQLFADLRSDDPAESEKLPADDLRENGDPREDTVSKNPPVTRDHPSEEGDGSLSSLLDATGPLLRRAFGKRNTGRHDASKELMRPTTHQVVDESA